MAKTLQVRDVPEDVHATITRKARAAGMTISQYLLRLVTEDAAHLSNAEVMTRARNLPFRKERSISTSDILTALDEGRAER
ncbi:hypothetical protein [Actinoallomurus sp. NPDC050550]|uniref:hypothetical protein n=1 Tax=Actinoallomurus sp. NPDC050550 TaxID=3154937 RepID=UPI0033C075CE